MSKEFVSNVDLESDFKSNFQVLKQAYLTKLTSDISQAENGNSKIIMRLSPFKVKAREYIF